MDKKVQKTFQLDPEHAERIERLAKQTGLSESAIVRNILKRWDGQVVITAGKGHETEGKE